MRSEYPVLCMFRIHDCLTAIPFAPSAFTGFIATMRWSDFWRSVSVPQLYRPCLPIRRSPDLPGTLVILHVLATPIDHGGARAFLTIYGLPVAVCDHMHGLDLRMMTLTGLIGFTLSHCGSHTPLSTLKSDLTASTPRLSTGCWLGFTGGGVSPP